jgi:hypothetical protein
MNNAPESIYSKLLRAEKDSTKQEIVDNERSKQIRVHLPAKVVRVEEATVDVEIIGEEDTGFGYYSKFPLLLNIPVIYNNYTSSAYILTPIQVGDTGIVEFLDFNAYNFINDGNPALTTDTYYHSLNNGTFINGFIPNNKVIDIPDDYPIMIGLHNQTFTLRVDDSGGLVINSLSNIELNSGIGVNINTPNVNCSDSLTCGNGATGSFQAGEKMVYVSGGIITDIV